MSDLRKAAEMVIEAHDQGYGKIAHDSAIEELRQALAQEQKREWVGLTVDEVIDVNDQVLKFLSETFKNPGYAEYSGALWRAIEAKLKEKNT